MTAFTEAIDRELAGVWFFSIGACPGCEPCGLEDVPDMGDPAYELASETRFSWSPCDSCGSTLGGDRHPAHGSFGDTMRQAQEAPIEHWAVCMDCAMYHANGEEPETWGWNGEGGAS